MLDIADLRFKECAYFYKLKNGKSVSPEEIHNMLVEVTAKWTVEIKTAPGSKMKYDTC